MNAIAEAAALTEAPLWERTRAVFARALAAVGAPAAIAAITVLSQAARESVVHWLLLLETIVRRLLLAEAAALPAALRPRGPRLLEVPLRSRGVAAPVNQTTAPKRTRQATGAKRIDLTQPETWPAQFALSLPRDGRLIPDSHAPRMRALWGSSPPPAPPASPSAPRRRLDSAFLLARRLEALRRVLNDPIPHARRLAHRLREAEHRCPQAAHQYLCAAPRVYRYDPCDDRLGIEAFGRAYDRRFAFSDSS
jgi:hypothetical protein